MGLIYRHVSPNGKSYVGQTRYPTWEKRVGTNALLAYESSPKFLRAIVKYGWENFSHEVLEDGIGDVAELNRLEIFWIAKLDAVNNGYNSLPGGGQRTSRDFSSESKDIDWDTPSLTELYVDQQLSLREVARIYGCSHALVREALIARQVPLHKNGHPNAKRLELLASVHEAKSQRACIVCGDPVTSDKAKVKTCSRSCASSYGRMKHLGKMQ